MLRRWTSRATVLAFVAIAIGAGGNCGGETTLTELVVVVDTDLDFASEVDRVTITADDGDGHVFEKSVAVDGTTPKPLTLGATAKTSLRPITFSARAILGGETVVERRIVAPFVRDERRAVLLTLCKRCRALAPRCSPAETCGERGCQSPDDVSLLPWTGVPPRGICPPESGEDAGPPDDGAVDAGAGPCAPVAAIDVSKPGYPHVCNVDAILTRDDVPVGLDYAMGGAKQEEIARSLTDIGGLKLPGCVAADFGGTYLLDPVVVIFRAVREGTACKPPACQTVEAPLNADKACSTCWADGTGNVNYCQRGGQLLVMHGTELGSLTLIGSPLIGGDTYRSVPLHIGKPTRYVVVCRSADGPATADVEVDAVYSNRDGCTK